MAIKKPLVLYDGVLQELNNNDNLPGGVDSSAIHQNLVGEINAITEKISPNTSDLILIEDSNDNYNKKKVQFINIYKEAYGRLNSELFYAPLRNSLDIVKGTGSITFSRASTATYIDRYGVVQIAAVDEPRFEEEGLLIEGSSTNLLLYSEEFETYWTRTSAITITANTTDTTAPDGSNNADRIEDTNNTTLEKIYQSVSVSDDLLKRIFSIFLKAGTSNIVAIDLLYYNGTTVTGRLIVDLNTGEAIAIDCDNYEVKKLKNGWYRVSVTKANNNSGNTNAQCKIFPAWNTTLSSSSSVNATGYVYAWGAQLEELPSATSYIPTTDSAVTRAADACYATYYGNVPNPDGEFSISLKFDCLGGQAPFERDILTLSRVHPPYFNQIRILANEAKFHYLRNGGNYVPSGTIPIEPVIFTVTVNSNDLVKTYINGILKTSNTIPLSDSILSSSNKIGIGCNDVGAAVLFGHVSEIRIYDFALTDLEASLL